MQPVKYCKLVISITASVVTLLVSLTTIVSAEVPDSNSYWKNLSAAEKIAKRYLDGAMQSCRGQSGADADAALKEWTATVQPGKHPGSDFNPCSGSGTLIVGKFTIAASDGRATKLSENGSLQTEWNFRTRMVNLWIGGDHISLSVSPISASVLYVSLGSFGAQKKTAASATNISEGLIISGLETFWRSAHDHYPKHSLYDVALQVITGKDEGREMLLDFIRCGKSICE